MGLVLCTRECSPGSEDTVIFRTNEERLETKCTVCGILLDVPCMVPGCPGHRNASVGDLCAYCAANARQEVPCLREMIPSLFSTLGDFEPDLDDA
jgi:hypothetical protein